MSHPAGASDCSIAIPALNEAPALARLLPRLAATPMDIFVCDNGSTDDTAAVVRHWARRTSRVTLLSEPTPGKPAAWNALMDAVSSAVVIFMDADVTPQPDCLARLCAAVRRTGHLVYTGRRQFVTRSPDFLPQAWAWVGNPVVELCLAGNLYALRTAAVRQRLHDEGFPVMPNVFAEDIWLQSLFRPSELLRVDAAVEIVVDSLSDYLELQARKRLVKHELTRHPHRARCLDSAFPEALRPWPQFQAVLAGDYPPRTKLRWLAGAGTKSLLNLVYSHRLARTAARLIENYNRRGGAAVLRQLSSRPSVGSAC